MDTPGCGSAHALALLFAKDGRREFVPAAGTLTTAHVGHVRWRKWPKSLAELAHQMTPPRTRECNIVPQ